MVVSEDHKVHPADPWTTVRIMRRVAHGLLVHAAPYGRHYAQGTAQDLKRVCAVCAVCGGPSCTRQDRTHYAQES
jgi:hypothetical protein